MKKRLVFAITLTLTLVIISSLAYAEKVSLDFWFGEADEDYIAAMEQIISDFESENPGIEVNIVKTDSPVKFEEPLLVAIAGGVGPDLLYGDGHWIQQFTITDKLFLPLNDLVPAQGLSGLNIIPSAKKTFQVNGRWIGMPFRTAAYGLYQNQTLLAKAGLPPKSGPETIDDLDLWAQKLTIQNADGTLDQIGFMPRGNNFNKEMAWLWVFGGDFFDWDNMTSQFSGVPAHQEALRWMAGYATRYGYDLKLGQTPFLGGTLALYVNSTTKLDYFPTAAPDLDFWVSAIPHPEGLQSTTYAPNLGTSVLAQSKHPEEAAKFVLYLARPEVQAFWYRQVRSIPCNMDALRMIAKDMKDPRELNMVNPLGNSFGPPPLLRDVQKVWNRHYLPAIQGEKSVDEALAAMDAELQPMYAEIFGGK